MTPQPFLLHRGNIHAVPILHYSMEMAAEVRRAYQALQPDCVAVELAETMQLQLLHAASRLPDIGVVISWNADQSALYYMCEPCDGSFEALRSALDDQIPAFCIDLDVEHYPDHRDSFPDPYAITHIGLENYYQAYHKLCLGNQTKPSELDRARELHMARRLKELSLSYDRVLFVGGMAHVERVLDHLEDKRYPESKPAIREGTQLCTLTEASMREVMAECGWITKHYERQRLTDHPMPDRHELLLKLYKQAALPYREKLGVSFPGYHLRNLMKFARNYALVTQRLMPDLYQLLSSAKGCVDHNYAYEVWELATNYPYRRNIDNLEELDLTIEQVWGRSKIIRFHMREPGRKQFSFQPRRKDRSRFRFQPPSPFSICSYPPEDVVVERFGDFLKKKGTQILTEESAQSVPFSCSLEDGIDTRETIRHWPEQKLYVKVAGKPPGGVGSVVIIFDEDKNDEYSAQEEFPWKTTWLGEHDQESDMAFYATPMGHNIVGPGISRCTYGGFMMSYPPRRMFDIWRDPSYQDDLSKPEVLLAAAIDYAVKPLIVYVSQTAPSAKMKNYARRFGKKVVYIPSGQLSPVTLRRLRTFHVLDGHDRREGASEFIP